MRMQTLKALLAGLSLALCATAAQAGWQDTASAFDQQRFARIDEARAKALSEAQAGASVRDLSIIRAVMNARPRRASVSSLLGNYRCRTIKLGGITPDVIYSWFRCRISMKGGGPYLEKLTGSQYTNGYLYPNGDGSFVYLGGSSVIGEPRHAYSGNGATVGAPVTPDDQIGLLQQIGPGHLRLEFPFPLQESTMDVLELRR